MPLIKSGSRAAISENIHEMQAAGHPHAQAVAAALHTADKYHAAGGEADTDAQLQQAGAGKGYLSQQSKSATTAGAVFRAEGGDMGLSSFPGTPPPGASIFSGPVRSSVPGRTDRHNMQVQVGSYVIPADVVSGLGQGNTEAGHAQLSSFFPKPMHGHGSGHKPHGVHMPHVKLPHHAEGGPTPMAAPDDPDQSEDPELTDVVVAGGEHILTPDQIKGAFGDLDYGHKVLKNWVLHERGKINKEQAKLPGPK